LPRYIRRQALQKDTASSSKHSTSQSHLEPKFRSRHFDPASEKKPKAEIKLLEPHVLSSRLKKLSESGKLEDAVALLKNAPLDAQNTQVWNTLIWECMKHKRFKLGYQLYVDLKRRGFSPTTRTFQTVFSGLSRIDDWASYPRQLDNARSLYEAFQRHIASVEKDDPASPELSVLPLVGYIKILGDSGHYQDIFDIYYAMETSGPMAPNQFIFTAMFHAISSAASAKGPKAVPPAKSAADARLLWNQMMKLVEKNIGFTVDSHTVTAAISALSIGRPTDHNLAFDLVHKYFGLSGPEEEKTQGLLPLQPQSLSAILHLCNLSKRPELCLNFFKQVQRRPPVSGGTAILDRAHMEEILRALLTMPPAGAGEQALEILEWMFRQEITGENGPAIRPATTTFDLVFKVCWLSVDWKAAMRTFELMTGYRSHDFMDGAVSPKPRFMERPKGRNIFPPAECLSSMVKTSLATKNRAHMRQCLRIIDHLDIDRILSSKRQITDESSKIVKNRAFYVSKLATAIFETAQHVIGGDEGNRLSSPEEVERWRELAERAKE
ncbi:hypothetical protein BDQ17DRAFT_1219986, partial [Cyathus striatus]